MARTIKCPICSKQVPFGDSNMPFCSDRCRVLDLANWATEKYSVPSGNRSFELEESDEDPPVPYEGPLQ